MSKRKTDTARLDAMVAKHKATTAARPPAERKALQTWEDVSDYVDTIAGAEFNAKKFDSLMFRHYKAVIEWGGEIAMRGIKAAMTLGAAAPKRPRHEKHKRHERRAPRTITALVEHTPAKPRTITVEVQRVG
jgi:hypothetical protein